MTGELLQRIETHLWPKGFRRDVWMIVETARDRRIYGLLLDCFYSQHSCLLSGTLPPELQVVAPYLVQLDYEDKKTRKFIREAWGKSWGVFLTCPTGAQVLRRHLRTFLVVRDPQGKRMMFRYYDPRVLRMYLPTCWPGELKTVFGPIDRFITEDETPDTIVDFSFDEKQLITTRHTLSDTRSVRA